MVDCGSAGDAKSQPIPDFAGVDGHILHTPGHTEDSFSLVVGEDSFVGDAARNILGFLGAPCQPILVCDRAACLESWCRLLSLGVKRIHPGHGKSFDVGLLIHELKSYHL